MADPTVKQEVCNICGDPATMKCKLCESTSYCSAQHQKLDWESHKPVCEAFVTLCDPLTGRTRCIATRKLHPGMLLVEEDALLSFPYWFSPRVNDEENCIVCGKNFNGSTMKLCSSCSWNLCNSFCEKRPEHVESECRVFSEYDILRPNGEDNSKQVSSLIAVLRGLSLRTTDPEAYENLLSLPTETFYSPYEHQLKLDCESMLKFLKKYMNPLEVEEELYERVFRVVEINRLQFSSLDIINEDVPQNGSIRGSLHTNFYVYDQTSYISHSCIPNCSWSIGPFPDRKIRIRVATEIAKGQELTIIKGFDPVYRECGTRERQLQFLRKRGIVCKCARCKDPKELGTYASAITCLRCRYDQSKASLLDENKGFLVPSKPLDLSPEAYYQCNNCENRILATQVNKLEIQLQQYSEIMCSQVVDKDNPYISVDRSVRTIRTKLTELHPTHWIVTNSIRNVVAGFSPLQIIITRINISKKSKKYLQNCIQHLHSVLVQETKISPGINPFAANLQALLGTKLAILIITFYGQLTSSEVLRYFRLHNKYCLDALKFYEGDFEFSGKNVNIITDHLKKTMDATAKVLPIALDVYRERK